MDEHLIKKPDDEHLLSTNQKYFTIWRSLRLLSSILAVIAIIPATLDYEMTYSEDRTFDTCSRDHGYSYLNRWVCLTLSVLALGILVPYRIYFITWKRHLMLTYEILPSLRSVSFAEAMEKCKKPGLKDYIDMNTLNLVIIYCLFPYPYLTVTFDVFQTMIEQTTVCYYFSELLYVFMFFRILVLFFHLASFTKYQNLSSVRHCEKYHVEPNIFFSAKCILNERPVFTVVCVLILPSIVIFATVLRVFERPAHIGDTVNSLQYFQNGFWNVLITMTTVGYGDVYPVTALGRIVCCFAALWGGIILSIMFATVGAFLLLADKQKNAYSSIVVSKAAANAVITAIQHKMKSKTGNPVTEIKDWEKVRNAALHFRSVREENQFNEGDPHIASIDKRLSRLEEKMEEFLKGMNQLLDK